MTGLRRLSHAISEGEAISVLVEVDGAEAARAAERHGAEGLVLRVHAGDVRAATRLPILLYGPDPDGAEDAIVLDARSADVDELEQVVGRAREEGIECVIKVSDEDELERVLERLDPEILLLSAEDADDGERHLERLLDLLPDVPAGKLAIAELLRASRDDVAELERAGVDAVLVGAGAGDLGGLVDEPPPAV
jgi:Indole-3-glycerol phosphate synthase